MTDKPTAYIIAGEDTGEMYQWSVTDVWYDEDTEAFYIYEDSGCSCNYPYQGMVEGQMTDLAGPYTFHQVLAEVSTNLVDKMLAWERKGKPRGEDVDRW